MAYCSTEDVLAEGIDDGQSERIESLLPKVDAYIERVTGLFFERREKTYTLSGNGDSILDLPAPLCQGDGQLLGVVFGRQYPVDQDLESFIVYDQDDDRRWARLGMDLGYVFPKGERNVQVHGWFGFCDYALVPAEYEDDPVPTWTTPVEIREVAVRLVMRALPLLGDPGAQRDRQDFRTTSETTRYRSVTLGALLATGGPTGDPDIDGVLAAFRRAPLGDTI